MSAEPEQYPSNAEKRRDFIIGVVLFFVGNVLLTIVVWVPSWLAVTFAPTNETLMAAAAGFSLLAPWLVNLIALLYFLIRRRWIALGMLAAFGVALLCVLVAGVLFAAVCFYSMGQGQ